MELEKRGIPALVLVSDVFLSKAREEAAFQGMPALRLAVFKHPLGDLRPDAVLALADGLVPAVRGALAQVPLAAEPESEVPPTVLAPADPADLQAFLYAQGWSEGLPVVPPTPAAVERMLAAARLTGSQVVGQVPPRGGLATVADVAANAVMAGCRPEHLQVVLAAVEAMLAPEFNLHGIQSTTHPVAPLTLVNGPLARELGIHSGAGALGPAGLANAVIGRAIRLVLWNLGGGRPGRGDRSTMGAPSKFSFCVAENEAESPWPPLHVERGFRPGDSTVTVCGVEPPHNVNDHESTHAAGILTVMADVMKGLGHNTWFLSWFGQRDLLTLFSPEHAATVAAGGFSRAHVQEFLFEHSHRPLAELRQGGMFKMRDWPPELMELNDESARVPPVPTPADILVAVVGGPGKHSAVLPSFGATRAVTRRIR